MTLHPFSKSGETDLYYTNLADKVCAIIEDSEYGKLLRNKGDLIYLSLCVTSWFEDVISQLGIWKAFTIECKQRYGTYIPFYDTDGTYTQDEINLADVKFLLWHHVQHIYFDNEFIYPNTDGLEETAEKIYELFDKEYETAPENENLRRLLCTDEVTENDFYQYRDLLKWFHYGCYFNLGNNKILRQSIENAAHEAHNQTELNLITYDIQNELVSVSRSNLLSLTTPEWMARIASLHPARKIWAESECKPVSYYTIEREDESYIYMKDLLTGEKGIKVNKLSVQMEHIDKLIENKSIATAVLFRYGSSWWLNGILSAVDNKKDTKEMIAKEKAKRKYTDEKAIYDRFKEANGGKWYAFFKDREALLQFLNNDMGFANMTMESLPEIKEVGDTILACATPHCGMRMLFGMAPCIKSDDNPLYDEATAKKYAQNFLFNEENIPYEVATLFNEKGMLPDATAENEADPKLRNMLDANRQFIIDYNLHGRRDTDLSPAGLW